MLEPFDDLQETPPSLACATCGHDSAVHVGRDVEEAGTTITDTFCEGCDRPCDFVPIPE